MLLPRLARLVPIALLLFGAACDKHDEGKDDHHGSLVQGSPADLAVGQHIRARIDESSYPYTATRVEILATETHHEDGEWSHSGRDDDADKNKKESAPQTGFAPTEEMADGTIGAVDTKTSSLTLLGLHVVIDPATVFEGASGLEDLKVGRAVSVGGALAADGTFHAVRVRVGGAELAGDVLALAKTQDGVKIAVLGRTVVVNAATEVLRPAPSNDKAEGEHGD